MLCSPQGFRNSDTKQNLGQRVGAHPKEPLAPLGYVVQQERVGNISHTNIDHLGPLFPALPGLTLHLRCSLEKGGEWYCSTVLTPSRALRLYAFQTCVILWVPVKYR